MRGKEWKELYDASFKVMNCLPFSSRLTKGALESKIQGQSSHLERVFLGLLSSAPFPYQPTTLEREIFNQQAS